VFVPGPDLRGHIVYHRITQALGKPGNSQIETRKIHKKHQINLFFAKKFLYLAINKEVFLEFCWFRDSHQRQGLSGKEDLNLGAPKFWSSNTHEVETGIDFPYPPNKKGSIEVSGKLSGDDKNPQASTPIKAL
jgi:hypothetical protein